MVGQDPSKKVFDVHNMEDLQLKCPCCCDKTFHSKPALIEHLANIMDNVVCPICTNKWPSLAHLIEHLSIDNCKLEKAETSELSNINVEEESLHIGLDELKGGLLHLTKDHKGPGGPFLSSIRDPEEGPEMGRMYVEFLSKQQAKPCLQTQELKLVKDGDVSRYVLVTNNNSNSRLNGSSTIVTKQNIDGTISLTVEDKKVEAQHSKVEVEVSEEDLQEVYSCNSCGVSFTSVLEHIQNYHNDQDVVVEELMDDLDPSSNEMPLDPEEDPLKGPPTDKMASRRMITETGDIVDVQAPMYLKNTSINLEQSEKDKVPEPQIKEEVMDKLGRTYTRRYVVVDKMCDPIVKDIQEPDEKSGPYHKVVIKEMETVRGDKIRVFHCMSCNTYVTNLDDFKSKPCKQLKYTCPHCPVAYENHRSLCAHMKAHKMRPVKYFCRHCSETYQNHRSLCAHMKVHKIRTDFTLSETLPKTPLQYECEMCNTVFQTHKSLKLHKRMHDPVKARPIEPPVEGVDGGEVSQDQFLCSVCDKLIPMDYRAIHVASHKQDKQEFHCDICNKLFHSRAYLEMHMSVHSAEKVRVENQDQSLPYQCVYCNRRFARPHEKVKHERIHTGEKPHSCEICGKSFRVSYCLTLHMRTHTGARPYECPHCGKRFKAHSVYNHHLQTHSDVRAYKCTFCPKAFKTSVQLAGHKNSHTKPFSCRHCNRPFASLYAVRVHTETHNRQNNLKFSCTLCGASYARAFALKDHMKQAHANKAEQMSVSEKDADWASPDVTAISDAANLKTLSPEVDITDLTVSIATDIAGS